MNPETKQADTMPSEPPLPLSLAYENAQNEMFSALNHIAQTYRIPPFLMKTILATVLYQVEKGADLEVRNARISYTKQLEEHKQKKDKTGGTENADNEKIES